MTADTLELIFTQICKISPKARGLAITAYVYLYVSVIFVRTDRNLAKIKNTNNTDFDIRHGMTPLRKLYSMTFKCKKIETLMSMKRLELAQTCMGRLL